MAEWVTIIAEVIMAAGAFFVLAGAIGMLRLNDFFERLHPASLKDSMGLPLIIGGLMLHYGVDLMTMKLFLLFIFVLYTSPTAAHALGKTTMLARNADQTIEDAEKS